MDFSSPSYLLRTHWNSDVTNNYRSTWGVWWNGSREGDPAVSLAVYVYTHTYSIVAFLILECLVRIFLVGAIIQSRRRRYGAGTRDTSLWQCRHYREWITPFVVVVVVVWTILDKILFIMLNYFNRKVIHCFHYLLLILFNTFYTYWLWEFS